MRQGAQQRAGKSTGGGGCREVATIKETEAKEEEEWLNVALFATQSVEEVGLSFDRFNHTYHCKKTKEAKQKKESQITRSSSKYKPLVVATYDNKKKNRKRRLCRADIGLAMWNTLSNLIGHFERYLWVLMPLHPSVLHEDSIRFALLGQPSETMIEDSPLLFNVNVAMACGTCTPVQ